MMIRLYEGNLRNRKQLCRELGIEPGSDRNKTERKVIEAGFQRWGHELPNHLYGSFAFALWDEKKGEHFCARDPFGIQTLYYSVVKDVIFLCGTDLFTILESPHYRKSLDREALQLYILFGYPIGDRTLYKGIRKLMPGCTLIWDGKSVQINRWYSLSFQPNLSRSEEEWANKIDHLLQEILKEDKSCFDFRKCRSFLSGGVDSSYLLASSGVSEAIGIGFSESICSETPFASAAAEKIGAHFHEVRISAEEYFDVIPRFLRNLELPLADPSAPAFALGCEQAKKKPVPAFPARVPTNFLPVTTFTDVPMSWGEKTRSTVAATV